MNGRHRVNIPALLLAALLSVPALARGQDAGPAASGPGQLQTPAAAEPTGEAPGGAEPSGPTLPAPIPDAGASATIAPDTAEVSPSRVTFTAAAITAGEMLSAERCVAIALKNHPSIIARSHEAGAARSRVGQARSGYYPQITLSSGYNKYSLISDPSNTVFGEYSSNARLSQSIFEFGRTWSQVSVQQRLRDASDADLRSTTNEVAFTVKSAYFSVLQAQKSVDVLEESVRSFEQHLEQARAFFETGVRSKFDVTKAEVDLSNARLLLIRGRNLLRTRQALLNNAMGVPDAPEYRIADDISVEKLDITLDQAVERAYASRPELMSLTARKEAAAESVSLAKKGFLPSLTGTATYIVGGDRYPVDESGWSAGVLLTFPLFSGFLTSYEVSEARENFYAARANEEGKKQEVLLDVQQAVLNLREAEERISVNELTVRQAEESYDIAKGRYEAGVGSIIEETDALLALRNAALGLISSQADYKVAVAALKRAMGEK